MLVIICTWKSQRMGTSNLILMLISWTWGCTTFHNFISMSKKNQKLAGLWLAGEVVNHVGIYGFKAAEGLSAFQRRSCISWHHRAQLMTFQSGQLLLKWNNLLNHIPSKLWNYLCIPKLQQFKFRNWSEIAYHTLWFAQFIILHFISTHRCWHYSSSMWVTEAMF